ncbi:protein phosphatase 2C domain-containing protein [Arachnia propionica]|uniref:PP2C family protein-serine/threonine phosphatase n=1 Tax=Arachnia propionica TaxID=1750 RepID=UPI0028E5F9C0|nr:protein phosphatase 2C domain-containing protein [Arachnia propionica]
MFSLDFRVHSEVGRVRKNNQDAAFASPNLLVVADGMGGAAAGDLASAVAAKEASEGDRRLDNEHLVEHMAGIVQRANDKLADLIENNLELDGMGTTFSGAAFSGTMLGVAHIGDSRGYLLREGELKQLTHDHSWVQSLIDEGRITPEQAATHPHRSLILKVLNGAGDTDPDFFELPVLEGDRVLFCSDGLSGLMSEEDLHELMSLDDLDECVSRLSALANEHGGHDNISLVLAQVVPQSDELDAAEPQLAGSALEREIPTITHEEEGPGYPEPEPAEDPDHDSTEQARYAPQESRNKRRWPTILAAILAGAIVVGVTFWGVRVYSSSRYFIAAADEQIGIYNGLPGSLLGHEMNTLVERRDTRISDLPVFFQRQVANTIGFSDLASARDAANTLDGYATRCARARQQRLGPVKQPGEPQPSEPEGPGLPTEPVATASLSNSPGGQTNYPTMLSPMSPTAAEEADPEAC